MKLNAFSNNSFRVDINSTESLFGNNTLLKSTVSKLQKYCECTMEPTGAINSISNYYAANCSIATETVLCSEKTTTQSLTNACNKYQNRYKLDVNGMDFEHHIAKRQVESDDTIASQYLTIYQNFDSNLIPTVILVLIFWDNIVFFLVKYIFHFYCKFFQFFF